MTTSTHIGFGSPFMVFFVALITIVLIKCLARCVQRCIHNYEYEPRQPMGVQPSVRMDHEQATRFTTDLIYRSDKAEIITDISCHTDASIPSPPPPTPADIIDMERLDAIQRNIRNGSDGNDFKNVGTLTIDTCRSVFTTPTHHGVTIS